MKVNRKIIEIDEELCNGCGECIVQCAEAALELVDGKAKLVAEKYCDGLGACLGECPTGALKVIERNADDFDEEAVEHRVAELSEAQPEPAPTMACGCPSSQMQSFEQPTSPCQQANQPVTQTSVGSELRQWPVQINLVPPTAPFLKGADLLVAADCVAFAHGGFHSDLLKGKVLMIGCPKFDDGQEYLAKFTEIFKSAGVRSVTTAFMEVPCCHGLPMIIKKAMQDAGKTIPLEHVIISVRGEVIKREQLVA